MVPIQDIQVLRFKGATIAVTYMALRCRVLGISMVLESVISRLEELCRITSIVKVESKRTTAEFI